MNDYSEHYNELDKQFETLIKSECDIPQEILDKIRKENYQFYMNPEQAKELNVADAIFDLAEVQKAQKQQAQQQALDMIEAIKNSSEEKEAEAECPGKETEIVQPEKEAEIVQPEKEAEVVQPEKEAESKKKTEQVKIIKKFFIKKEEDKGEK